MAITTIIRRVLAYRVRPDRADDWRGVAARFASGRSFFVLRFINRTTAVFVLGRFSPSAAGAGFRATLRCCYAKMTDNITGGRMVDRLKTVLPVVTALGCP